MRILYVTAVVASSQVLAQTAIEGKVLGHEQQPLLRANVVLLDKENTIVAYTWADKNGQFSLKTDQFGTFSLEIAYNNYTKFSKPISIIERNKNFDLGTINLQKDITEIKEVIITKANPIKIKKDTVEINASSYRTGTEQNVQDLIKKIPGVTVSKDGKIRVKDKEVQKVLIEGEDLFEKGYQTLTQSMSAEPLDKVQIISNYSKNKLLKNIEKTDALAINLTLKEDAKSKWMGQVNLASTSYVENRQQVKFNLMNFSKRQKIYLLFNHNNLGFNEMSGVDYLIKPEISMSSENVGDNLQLRSLVALHQKNMTYNEERTNFNNDKLASANYIYQFRSKWKINFAGIYNHTQNRNYEDSYYRFNDGNLQFTNTENKVWKQNLDNWVGKLELSKEYTKSSLVFYNKTSQTKEENENSFLFNGMANPQKGYAKQTSHESRITYTKKLDDISALVATARYYYVERPHFIMDYNDVFHDLINNNSANQIVQNFISKVSYAGTKVSYLKAKNDDRRFDASISAEFRKENLDSELKLFDDFQNTIDFNTNAFKNNLEYQQNNVTARVRYSDKVNKDWTYSFNVKTQYLVNSINSVQNDGLYISPEVSLNYNNRKFGNFSMNGTRQFASTQMTDLLVNYMYQGNRSFKQSRIDPVVMANYNLGFNYSFRKMVGDEVKLMVNYLKNEDYLSQNIIAQPSYSLSQTILVKDNNIFIADLEIKRYLKFLKSIVTLQGGYQNSDYKFSVNDQGLKRSRNEKTKLGWELKSGWRKSLNFVLGYEWLFNKINSEVNQFRYRDEIGFANLNYNINKAISLEGDLEYFRYGNTGTRSVAFLDVKANYKVERYKVNFYVHANNLLNIKYFERYSISNISESLYTQRLLPCHVVLGFNKNF